MLVIIQCALADDIEVQEVFEGQTSLLLPPKGKFKLSNSSPNCMSPMRSLTPCDAVPRPAFLRCVSDVNDAYKLRRPSSHYDAQAQAASSRPTSRQDHSCHTAPCQSPPAAAPPIFGPVHLHCFQNSKNLRHDIAVPWSLMA